VGLSRSIKRPVKCSRHCCSTVRRPDPPVRVDSRDAPVRSWPCPRNDDAIPRPCGVRVPPPSLHIRYHSLLLRATSACTARITMARAPASAPTCCWCLTEYILPPRRTCTAHADGCRPPRAQRVPCTLYPVPSKGATRPPFSAPSQAPATFPAEPSQFSSTQSKSIEPPAAASLLVPPGAALAMSSILLPVPCTSSSLLPVPCTSSSLLYTSSNGGRASEA